MTFKIKPFSVLLEVVYKKRTLKTQQIKKQPNVKMNERCEQTTHQRRHNMAHKHM